MFFVILVFGLSVAGSVGTIASTETIDHLDETLRKARYHIVEKHVEQWQRDVAVLERTFYFVATSNNVAVYDVSWEKRSEGSKRLHASPPLLLHLLDRAFLLDRNGTLSSLEGFKFSCTLYSSNESVAAVEGEEAIEFARSAVWKATLYLFVCYDVGFCSLYTSQTSSHFKFIYRQSMRYKGLPSDARFFSRANRLYLVVAVNAVHLPVPSVIYHWSGTYMDVLAELLSTGALSVTTFRSRRSVILVLAQNVRMNSVIGSDVYEFQESAIRRIQLLRTCRPISVRHYKHDGHDFILVTNEAASSSVFWWSGREFIQWVNLLETASPSLVTVASMHHTTYFLVARNASLKVLQLLTGTRWLALAVKEFGQDARIVDLHAVARDPSFVDVVLVTTDTKQQERAYSVESWRLNVKSRRSHGVDAHEGYDTSTKCLSTLRQKLQGRMWKMKESPLFGRPVVDLRTWQPTAEKLSNVILHSGVAQQLQLLLNSRSHVPLQLQEMAATVASQQQQLGKGMSDGVRARAKNVFSSDVVVETDAYLTDARASSVHVTSIGSSLHSDVISRKDQQTFAHALSAQNVTLHDVEVHHLCDIPKWDWATIGDTKRLPIEVSSAVFVPNLKIKRINDVDVDPLISQLFRKSDDRSVSGDLVYAYVVVKNFTSQFLNAMPSQELLTRTSNQSSNELVAATVHTDRLLVDRINGVPPTEAAMKFRENVVDGEVKATNVHITDALVVDTSHVKMSRSSFSQIYDDVCVTGHVAVRRVNLESSGRLVLEGDRRAAWRAQSTRTSAHLQSYWRKSKDQTLSVPLTFRTGLTIDRLDVAYLNGFTQYQFLYRTVQRVSAIFANLHFDYFHLNSTLRQCASIEDECIDLSAAVHDRALSFPANVSVRRLRVKDLTVDRYSGIPIDGMFAEKDESSGWKVHVHVPYVIVQSVVVRDMMLQRLNERALSLSPLHVSTIRIYHHFRLDSAAISPKFHCRHLHLQRLNGLRAARSIESTNLTIGQHLHVVGNVTLTADFAVARVNDRAADLYLDSITNRNMTMTERNSLEELIVRQMTIERLRGREFGRLSGRIFLRSASQEVSSNFSFDRITSNEVASKYVNDVDVVELAWTDEPMSISANVTFTQVHVVEDAVVARAFNGRTAQALHGGCGVIFTSNGSRLDVVGGNLSWRISSVATTAETKKQEGLSRLFGKALRRDGDAVVRKDAIFLHDVHASTLLARTNEETRQVAAIVANGLIDSDSDSGQTVEVVEGARKIFSSLQMDVLAVDFDVSVATINSFDVGKSSEILVDRYGEQVEVIGGTTFAGQVSMQQLKCKTCSKNEESKSDAIDLATQLLPNNVHFEELCVSGNVQLRLLDEIDLESLIAERVALSASHVVRSDVQFQGRVQVRREATVRNVNGIRTEELAFGDDGEASQTILGAKTFRKSLLVKGSVQVTFLNGVDVSIEFANSLLNGQSADVLGDVIFESRPQMKSATVEGAINGMKREDLSVLSDHHALRSWRERESRVESAIARNKGILGSLPNVFRYMEKERDVSFDAQRVTSIEVVDFGGTTKVNMYGEEDGSWCGLANDCRCHFQYTVVLSTADGCRAGRTVYGNTVRNLHERDGTLDVDVTSNAVSYDPRCTANATESEYTTIAWMSNEKVGGKVAINTKFADAKIKGFVKDAQMFMHKGEVYITVAIYYDATKETHRTNSFVYRLDLKKENLTLHQSIASDGAWAMLPFKINEYALYLFVASTGDSMGSRLYKFDPLTSKFIPWKNFDSRSRYAKSCLYRHDDHFLMFDDPSVNAVHVFRYNWDLDNFVSYQLLLHESLVSGIECFYSNYYETKRSALYLLVITEDSRLHVYEYNSVGKFQRKEEHRMNGVQAITSFRQVNRRYLLLGTTSNTTILRIVLQG